MAVLCNLLHASIGLTLMMSTGVGMQLLELAGSQVV